MQCQNIFENLGSNLFCLWKPDNIIQVSQDNVLSLTEKICTDKNCKFPQLALRIFNHLLAGVDNEGKVTVNARLLSKKLGVNYDTVTKCIKYLKHIEIIKADK